jgi:hypothetical protein
MAGAKIVLLQTDLILCTINLNFLFLKMKTSVVHGDFRLDNIIFDKQDSRLKLVMVLTISTFKEHPFSYNIFVQTLMITLIRDLHCFYSQNLTFFTRVLELY